MKSDAATVDLPSPSISWQEALAYFNSRGLGVLDMTTLLGKTRLQSSRNYILTICSKLVFVHINAGAHTMGQTHCSHIVDRLYNYNGTGNPDPSMNATFLDTMKKLCPPRIKKGQHDPLVYLNPESGSNYIFRESYYKRILHHEAVLGVDQQLLNGDDTKEISEEFAAGFEDFRRSFARSMFNMGNIKILTGNQGEIRRNCRYTNKGKLN